MNPRPRSGFLGEVGQVLLDTLSPTSFVTGFVLAIPFLLAVAFAVLARSAQLAGVAVLLSVPVTVIVLSRMALNGLAGETEGTVFTSAGGGFDAVLLVGARYFTLVLIWLSPIILYVGLKKGGASSSLASGGLGVPGFPFPTPVVPDLVILYSASSFLVPSMCLAVAVASETFGDIFSGATWSELFSERWGKLFVVLSVGFGGPFTLFVVLWPFLSILLLKNPKLAVVVIGFVLVYLGGIGASLLGLLCGRFAADALAGAEYQEEQAPPAARQAQAASAAPGGAAHEDSSPVPALPPVEGAEAAIGAAAARFASDPRGAIRELEAAQEGHAPHPRLLHTLVGLYLKAQDTAGAAATAREAIPACLAAGETRLAYELFRPFVSNVPALKLDRAQLCAVGEAILKEGDQATAAHAYGHALVQEPGDVKAFKGLMRIADHHLGKGEAPDQAAQVFRFLLQRAPQSPLAEHAREGLALAERRLAKG